MRLHHWSVSEMNPKRWRCEAGGRMRSREQPAAWLVCLGTIHREPDTFPESSLAPLPSLPTLPAHSTRVTHGSSWLLGCLQSSGGG